MNDSIEVTIIMPVKNGQRYLVEVLTKIFEQDVSFDYEVIVIDSGSKDKTLEILKKYSVKILKIRPEEFNHGTTRNLGAKLARGRFIVFLNQDAIPQNDRWLAELLVLFQDKNVVATYSKNIPRQNLNPLRRREIENEFPGTRREQSLKEAQNFDSLSNPQKKQLCSFHTISCAIRKEIFDNNCFKQIEFAEDLEWAKRMIRKGYKLVYQPDSLVVHSHDLYTSLVTTYKRYKIDAKMNRILIGQTVMINSISAPVFVLKKWAQDTKYIIRTKIIFPRNIIWIIYSPIVRTVQAIAILTGYSLTRKSDS